MMNKKILKKLRHNQKGITLIALVITIVILIILATISINFVFNGGLIDRAEQARDYYQNDEAYTDESITNLTGYIDGLINGVEGGGTSGAKTLVQAFNDGEIKVGDYVDYKPEAHDPVTVTSSESGYTNSASMSDGTDQIFSQDESTTWRVLGLSEDGQHLLLTSGSPIKKDGDDPYLVLESYTGADKAVEVLNRISGLYHNSSLAEETRSMTIEDIERVVGDMTVQMPTEAGNDGKVYFTDDESQTNIGQTTPYPRYTYKEGNYTLTNPPQPATAGETVNADLWAFFYTTAPGEDTRASYIDETVFDMLFAGTTGSSNYAKSYWLASPGVYALSDDAYFGPGVGGDGLAGSGVGLFYSDGYWYAGGFAVRPVVVLKSNITVDQVKEIEDQEEDPWTGLEGGQDYGGGNIE